MDGRQQVEEKVALTAGMAPVLEHFGRHGHGDSVPRSPRQRVEDQRNVANRDVVRHHQDRAGRFFLQIPHDGRLCE
jgi:hypothetical protein